MKNLAEKTHSQKIGERREQGCRVATSAKAGRYVATELSPKLGRYVATELSPKLGRYVATEHVHCSVAT
ncbi:hypothetical protein F2Q70_00038817 [Brassica cretica]|uniref:Uncharacterized protein n=1 Tax=Brassica cretica TaxID=69181 RepID=A0A8S9K9G9_BRACR|nr:hypothetical protein F2Q70_00038817 [Brassica cretica]